jgi:hypothetical protein
VLLLLLLLLLILATSLPPSLPAAAAAHPAGSGATAVELSLLLPAAAAAAASIDCFACLSPLGCFGRGSWMPARQQQNSRNRTTVNQTAGRAGNQVKTAPLMASGDC